MNVLVAGAGGAVGNKLVSELSAGGHSVIGLVHSKDKFAKVQEAGGKPILADVTDKASLRLPVSEADVVVFAAGSGGKAVEAVDRDGAINLIDAAKEHGAARFIMLSTMAAGEPDRGPDQLRDYLIAKGAADDHLKDSGLSYSIMRPGSLTDDGPSHCIAVDTQCTGASGEISRSDVAKTLAACVVEHNSHDVVFEVVSGEQPILETIIGLAG